MRLDVGQGVGMVEPRGSRRAVQAALIGALVVLVSPGLSRAQHVDFQLIANGLTNVTDIANAGDARLFVVQQGGLIKIIQNGSVLPNPFLNISSKVTPGPNQGERGLLGLAFHPNYATNGFFYVDYTDVNGDTVVARYSRSVNDPNLANANTEVVILTQDQPFNNHNGGDLNFGPDDGYLYITFGDGGSGCDPDDNGQNGETWLGKILRIDVDSASPYAIPDDNPFIDDPNVLDEIWSDGFRNPWRFAFDRNPPHDMFIADVGQGSWEEIDHEPGNSPGGVNYGWDCFEGTHAGTCDSDAVCPPPGGHVLPVNEYSHGNGRCSVTGGFVYRGELYPGFTGRYFFGDFCSRDLWSLSPIGGGDFELTTYDKDVPGGPRTFGEDMNGEVYVGTSNSVYRLVDSTPPPPEFCPATPADCDEAEKASLTIKDHDPSGASAKDAIQFRFLRGPAIAPNGFGDPSGDTGYRLCIYGGSPQTVLSESLVSGGGTCDGKPCWKALGSGGFKFRDREGTQDGAQTILLRAKPMVPATKVLWKAANGAVPLPPLPLSEQGDVSVRVHNTENGFCWGVDFSPSEIVKNEDTAAVLRTR